LVNRGKRFIKLGQKFISLPLSGKILKKGDSEDGLFFIGYVKGKTATKEKWCDQESWFHMSIREVLRGAKIRARQKNFPFNISLDYLKDIYPHDSLCPVFGCEMSFGNTIKWRSASLDRVDVDQGYVEGNVQWICNKANTIKNNAHPYELLRLATYTVNQLREKDEQEKK